MRAAILAGLTAVLLAIPTAGQPPAPKPLTDAQKEKLKEAAKYSKESDDLERSGKWKEAIAVAEKLLAVEREVFGKVHEYPARTLERTGKLHMRLEDWKVARAARQECLEVRTALHGKDDWRVTDARIALADVDLIEKLTDDQRIGVRQAKE